MVKALFSLNSNMYQEGLGRWWIVGTHWPTSLDKMVGSSSGRDPKIWEWLGRQSQSISGLYMHTHGWTYLYIHKFTTHTPQRSSVICHGHGFFKSHYNSGGAYERQSWRSQEAAGQTWEGQEVTAAVPAVRSNRYLWHLIQLRKLIKKKKWWHQA